jgi:hypothetical protein
MASPREIIRLLIAEIDRSISAAYTELTSARAGYAHCPSAARGSACVTAEAFLDELLDLRVALTAPKDLVEIRAAA